MQHTTYATSIPSPRAISSRRLFRPAALPGWLIAVLLLVAAPFAHAQFRTSIQGTVTDATGAAVPGATLTLTDLGTNETQVRTSDPNGVYNFNALPADTFKLEVAKSGFQTKVLDQLQLIPEQPNGIDVILAVGTVESTVTVNASTEPALDTETANIQHTISDNEVQHLPTYQRDVTGLIQLAPGVLADGSQSGGGGGFKSPGTQTGASSGGGGNLGHSSSVFSTENGASANANGGQFETNGYTVDGISTVSAVWGGSTVITPSEDSVSNVKIVTNAYDAENGRFSGALTEITSKSGSNQIHGSAFVQVFRPGLNAYQRWNGVNSVAAYNSDGTKKKPADRGLLRDEDRYNQLGGSIGGPIWKNKIFAFFAYEGQKQDTPATGTAWLLAPGLTALAPSGSIASTYLNFPKSNVLGTIIGSATCDSAGLIEGVNCRTIQGQGLNIGSPLTNGLGKQDLTFIDSNNPGVGSGLSNVADISEYSTSNPTKSDYKQYNGRIDADVTSKDHISFAIYWVPSTRTNYNGDYGYQLFHHAQTNNAFSGIWNHTFSPNLLNEFRANAAGWRWNELASNPQAPFGLPQDSITTVGHESIGSVGVSVPSILDQWTYGVKDVATKVFHSQTMKFGFDGTRLYYLNDPIGAPNYTFYNVWDFLNDAPEAEGGPFQAATGLPGGYRNDNRETMFGVFFQDDWKVRPNLTVSAGIRYSYFGPLTDKANHMGVLEYGSGSSYFTALSIQTHKDAWNAQKLNFGPQVGFNWAPAMSNGKVVFRGGYGLNYNQEQIANANAYDGNPPGTNYIGESSQSPSQINPNILYAVASTPTGLGGYPANPAAVIQFNAAGLPTAGGANLNGLPHNLPTEYSHHYSVDMEIDLGHSVVANLGYEGSSTHHSLYNYDAKALADIQGIPQNSLVNSINTFGSGGKANNNALLAGLKHQFSHTFSAEAQYTWAHSMDTDSGPYSRDPYLYNPRYSYGRSDYDVNQSFKLFGVWEPVIFHGSQNWAEKVVGGWSLSGIFTYHTGFGWTPTFTAPHQFYCNTCNYGYVGLRPYYKGGAGMSTSNDAFKTGSNFANNSTGVTGTNHNLFNNNLFSVPDYSAAITDLPGQATNVYFAPPGSDRNSMPGPDYKNFDATVSKAFGLPSMKVLGEGSKIEIKANVLNVFNNLNIDPSSLSTNVQNSDLGRASRALGSRTVDFQARFSF